MTLVNPPQVLTILARDGRVVGTATVRAEEMGVRVGEFHPAPAYLEIRLIFRGFAESLERGDPDGYYRERDALGLRVVDQDGRPVPGVVHLLDLDGSVGSVGFELYPV